MKNKKGIEMSFGWIFSIIVGGAIIALSLYATSRLVNTERTFQDSESALVLSGLLQPLETGAESGSRPANLSFPSRTRIYNTCKNDAGLGLQEISVAQKSRIGEVWQKPGIPQTDRLKYLFSSNIVEGKEFFLLVKPIYLPFKVGDIIILWTGQYCFVNPTREVEDELGALGLTSHHISIAGNVRSCVKNSTSVCFSGTDKDCDIVVDVDAQQVIKQKQILNYEGPLMYGAIFAEPKLYECQVKRILKRAASLSSLYRAKSELVAARSASGCSSSLQQDLFLYSSIASNASSSAYLGEITTLSQQLEYENKQLFCKLWEEQ